MDGRLQPLRPDDQDGGWERVQDDLQVIKIIITKINIINTKMSIITMNIWLKNQLVCHSNHDATYLDCGFGAWVSRATFIRIFEINRWTCCHYLFLFLCAGRKWSQLVFSVQAVASPARQRSLRDPWTAGWRKPWTSCGQKAIPSLASRSLLHSLHKIEYIIVLAKSTFHFVLMMYNYNLHLFAYLQNVSNLSHERKR